MESYVSQANTFEQTRDAKAVLGKRVLAKNGSVVGKVKQVRLDPQHRNLQGVVVSRGLFRSSLYVSEEYISRLTPQAVILTINPACLMRGRVVVSSDGKRFGTVKEVSREQETNNVVVYLVKRYLFWVYELPADEVAKANRSLVLKKTYEQAKSSFKKAS